MNKIGLVADTIDKEDVDYLIKWLETNPRLTKGEQTLKFEEKWAKYIGTKHAVYVNSGSSANLLMTYAMKISNRLKNDKVVVPALSWATTVTPLVQFGMTPILCDADRDTLGMDTHHLEKIFQKENPAAVIIVHALGFPCKMNEIYELCAKYGVILLEDSCETVGSTYNGKKTGNFGIMSTFSFYFGHHISTIEGGMVCTDDDDIHDLLLMLRSHGWDRDLSKERQEKLRKQYDISEFKSLYSFYHPGFNLRATDLQAYIGIKQIDKLEHICKARHTNFFTYDKYLRNEYWAPRPDTHGIISNFAYPIIHPKRNEIQEALTKAGIENRPLICGSIGTQPFFEERYGRVELEFADIIDRHGLYVPNHLGLTEDDIEYICSIINGVINE
jgi:CDP-6-deoxy-D-xylo-4-hexulose-3-dehydrase